MTQIDRRQFLVRGTAAAAGLGLAVTAGGLAGTAAAASAPRPRVAATGDWWALPIRSGRPWASGVTYWNYDSLAGYDAQVALSDGGGGASWSGRTDTWEMLAGGPVDDPGTIARRSHLDWSEPGATNFGAVFHHLPPGGAWLCWVFPTVPEDPDPRGPLTGSDTVWHRVARGERDRLYRAMGARIRRNLDARGVPLERFLGRPNHEMNQSNAYQVFPETTRIYRAAMERTIDKIREGADYPLHMAHAPALSKKLGPYLDWCPSNCDVLSISYHPSNAVTDEASWRAMIERGSSDRYAVNDLLRASDVADKPIAFLEWSPRYEEGVGCPIADKVYTWTHDRLFAPNKDRLVVDLVHSPRTLDKGAYEGGGPGAQAWARGVDVYKRLWSGLKG